MVTTRTKEIWWISKNSKNIFRYCLIVSNPITQSVKDILTIWIDLWDVFIATDKSIKSNQINLWSNNGANTWYYFQCSNRSEAFCLWKNSWEGSFLLMDSSCIFEPSFFINDVRLIFVKWSVSLYWPSISLVAILDSVNTIHFSNSWYNCYFKWILESSS